MDSVSAGNHTELGIEASQSFPGFIALLILEPKEFLQELKSLLPVGILFGRSVKWHTNQCPRPAGLCSFKAKGRSLDNLGGNVLKKTQSQPNCFALCRLGNDLAESVPAGGKRPVVCFVKREGLCAPTCHENCITISPATMKLGKLPQAKGMTYGQGKGLPSCHH